MDTNIDQELIHILSKNIITPPLLYSGDYMRFFGKPAWRFNSVPLMEHMGNRKIQTNTDYREIKWSIALRNNNWPAAQEFSLQDFTFDGERLADYSLSFNKYDNSLNSNLLLLFPSKSDPDDHDRRTAIVGAYTNNRLTIHNDHRSKGLSLIMIFARASQLQGIPNPNRPMSMGGIKAFIQSYIWFDTNYPLK